MPEETDYDELVMTLVESALERPATERESFLRSVCGENARLYGDVLNRIGWEERMGAFLREPLLPGREVLEHPFQPGELVGGRFRIVRPVGRGGMGIVYEAVDVKLDRRIAIKCARLGFGKRLPPEARAAREVSHFNVCKVYDLHSVEAAGREVDFLTMEFIEGETLSARLRKPEPLPADEVREIVLQIVAGLAQAHRQGVVHGDLKPGNVILSKGPSGGLRVVLTDFGLAKLLGAGAPGITSERGGTLDYMAPELFLGQRATTASDIYALGVLLHEMLTGHSPRRPEKATQTPSTGADESTLTLDYGTKLQNWKCEIDPLPLPWRPIVRRCLQGVPEARYATADEIAVKIRPRTWSTLWAAACCALIVLAAVVLWQWRKPDAPRVRLAVLPIQVDGEASPVPSGVAYDIATRLSGARRGFTVLPPQDARQYGVSTAEQAGKVLGASHALATTMRHQGAEFTVHAALFDTATNQALGRLDGTYPDNDPSRMAKALIGTVTNALGLRSSVINETVAPSAYADYVQGMALLRRDNESADLAMPLFRRAIQNDPRSALPPAALAEAQLLKYRISGDKAWLAQAKDTAARAVSLNPDSSQVLLLQGSLKYTGGAYEDAARDYQRATELDPQNVDAWYRLALAYGAMRRSPEALATYQRAMEVQPDYFRHYLDLFNFYFYRGQYVPAEATIRKLIAIAPGLYSAHTNLGTVLLHTGRYEEARAELDKSLKLRETSTALHLYGGTYYYERRFPEGVPYLERVIALGHPGHNDYMTLGKLYHFAGRENEARAAFRTGRTLAEQAITANPRGAIARAHLALFSAYLGEPDRARYEIAQAVQMSADDSAVLRTAAEVYELTGEHEKALATLQQAPRPLLEDMNRSPESENLQRDPRFQELLKKQPLP